MKTTIHWKNFSLILFGSLMTSVQIFSQLSYGGEPYNWQDTRYNEEIPLVSTEVLDMELIHAQDAINDTHKEIPFRFGIEHEVNYNINNGGQWNTDETSGMEIWQLAIRCPEAKSINLTFNEFSIPKGGKLFIWSADRNQYLGAFDHRNNEESGILATGIIHTEHIVVEYQVPSNKKAETKLSIGQIVHGYRPILKNEFVEDADNRGPFGSSGNCHNNVICPVGNDWQIEKRSVVVILLGGSICSGVLVNNTANDGTPYILTANHCTPTNNNVSNWIFYFNHDSPTCNGSNGPTNNSISGATFRAKRAGSDFALVQMSSTPPSAWNPHYAGWDATDNENVSNTVGIHHPGGDVKKISFDNDEPFQETSQGTYVWVVGNWEDGVTEGGSSGSPLFNQQHRIIGQLYAGSSECIGTQENDGYDIYGRFGISWNTGSSSSSRLREWLDPGNTGTLVLNGYPDGFTQVALDAAATGINGVSAIVCGNQVSPVLVLHNNGTQTLTSCTIGYQLNGGTTQTFVWTGSLGQNQSTSVNIPTLTTGIVNNIIVVTVSNPNGSPDQNAGNNSFSFNFSAIPGDNHALSFELTFDEYPEETSWNLRNENNLIVYTSGGTSYDASYAETTINLEFCIPSGCYTFNIFDSEDDGICCQYGIGSYELTDENGAILADGGNFDASESTPFCLTDVGINESAASKVILYPNPANELLTIQHKEIIQSISIRDITGKLILSFTPNAMQAELNTVSLANGVYTCEISTAKGLAVEKLLIKH